MKYLEDSRLTQLTTDLTGSFLNTRGSGKGGGGGSFSGNSSRNTNRNSGYGKGKGKSKQQQQSSSASSGSGASTPRKNKRATSPSYFAYNPVGYSTYGNGGQSSSSHSSCRVIFGRVEAYTTKRAGSDKKTAFEVGERYAHEMERLNEAVEALKRRHALEHEQENKVDDRGTEGEGRKDKAHEVTKKVERRGRSRSLDGVTFASAATPEIVYDKSANTAAMMDDTNAPLSPLEERVATEEMKDDKGIIKSHVKRNLPLEGILKQPSSNKRCRATSFDVSTGPSTAIGSSTRKYHHCESSSSLLAGSTWGNGSNRETIFPLSIVHPSGISGIEEEDHNIHPLIPQPSLYQSSLSEHASNGDKTPTMVPRRLVTDLILTLNASFPDYDFGDAQISDFFTLPVSEAMRRINDNLGEFAATTDEGSDFLPRLWSSLDDVLFGLKECEVYSYAPQGSTGEDDPMEFLTMSMAGANEGNVGNASNVVNSTIGGQGTVMFTPSGGGRIVSEDMLSGLDDSMALDQPNQISPASGSDSDSPHVTIWSMNYFFVSRNKKRIVLFACVQTMRTPQGYGDDDYFDESDEYENNVVFDEARRGIETQGEKGGSLSTSKAELSAARAYTLVEDTDFDEQDEQGVDVDGDVDQGENDYDTGALSLPSQVA